MPVSRSAPRLQPDAAPTASNAPASAEVAWQSPAASSSQPIGFRGRCQASSPPQAANARPIAPLVTVKLPVASAKDIPAASAQPTAAASSASARQHRAAAVSCHRPSRWPVGAVPVMGP